MDFTLLKTATSVINEREAENKAIKMIAHNLSGVDGLKKFICETAEEFLMQMFTKVKNHGTFTPEEVQRMAPIAAALQLISSNDTRDSVMAKFQGDEQKNLVTISKGVSKTNTAPGKVDQVLVQIGQANAKTLVDKLTSILNDPQSPDRNQLSADLQKLAGWFRSQPGNLEKTQPIPYEKTQPIKPMNQSQSGGTGGQTSGQQGSPAGSAGMAAGPAAGPAT